MDYHYAHLNLWSGELDNAQLNISSLSCIFALYTMVRNPVSMKVQKHARSYFSESE